MKGVERLEVVIRQFNKANTLFSEAIRVEVGTEVEVEVERRKELLEQAFRAYVDILPLLQDGTNEQSIMLIRRAVLEKIHAVEAWIEQEIEKSVIGNSNSSGSNNNSNSSSKEIEEVLTKGID